MKLKRLHQEYPIFSILKKDFPYYIYVLQDNLDSIPWYVGLTTNPIKRYQKRVAGATGSAYFLNDSRECLDRFKSVYKAGIAPVMLIVSGADNEAAAKEAEKQYRTLNNNTIINKITGRTPYAKDQYHRTVWTVADRVYDYKNTLFTIALLISISTAIFYIKRNQSTHDVHYNY